MCPELRKGEGRCLPGSSARGGHFYAQLLLTEYQQLAHSRRAGRLERELEMARTQKKGSQGAEGVPGRERRPRCLFPCLHVVVPVF